MCIAAIIVTLIAFFLFQARLAHLKKCASAFKISPVALMEGIKIQKSDYGIQLARQVA